MRLKYIKLAGFKSFVDPTKVAFPDAMTAIVGPNGCGKSNVIDAVRWVLGESNAKNLRGDAMSDVIFNGSTGRKPVSLASVELVFDNQSGRLQGPYGSYSEVSVKRQVNRDGVTRYFLNGAQCRRRDVTDLFMGTGLGPRSYAIIEQGTVSRLIESKPHELRVFIEEAAGISRYKERRRETENRIRHTRDNLARLADIRLELGTQIDKLQKQAAEALKYRQFKQQERTLQSQITVLRWQQADQQSQLVAAQLTQLSQRLQGLEQAEQGGSQLLQLQQAKTDLMAYTQQIQQQRLQSSTQISALEQQQHSHQERQQLWQHQLQVDLTKLADANERHLQLQQTAEQLRSATELRAPLLMHLNEQRQTLNAQLQHQEQRQLQLDKQRDQALQQQAEADKAVERSQALGQQLQHEQQLRQQQLTQLQQQQQQLGLAALGEQLQQAQQQQQLAEAQYQQAQQDLVDAEKASHLALQQMQQQQQLQQQMQQQQHQQQAQIGAIETLLQNQAAPLPEALQQQPRLWQQVVVQPQWAQALETVMGAALQGLVMPAEALQATTEASLPAGSWFFVEQMANGAEALPYTPTRLWPTLFDKVSCGDLNLTPWLNHVYCAADEAQRQQWLSHCLPHESVVLVDGSWAAIGARLSAGQLSRPPLTELHRQQQQLQEEEQQLSQQLQLCRQQLVQEERTVHEAEAHLLACRQQTQHTQEHRFAQQSHCDKLQQRLELLQQQQQQWQQQQQQLITAEQQAQAAQQQCEQQQQQAQVQLQQANLFVDESQNVLLETRLSLKTARVAYDETQQQLQQQQLRQQTEEAQFAAITEQAEHAQQQVQQWQQSIEQLQQQLQQADAPEQQRQLQLTEQRQQLSQAEAQLLLQQQQLADLEGQLQATLESQRGQQEQRHQLQQQKAKLQAEQHGHQIKAQGQLERLAESGHTLTSVLTTLPASASLAPLQQQLEQVKRQLMKLGAINLAAIEEFDQQTQRKSYLDQQDQDLTEALAMLEGAITKIDRETRARFKATFDAINGDFGELFPKVFGGGHAYLALTEDQDLLTAGVSIMARPPGKNNSTIQLLSGGEKALTALSLVFAIFRLNPAPFCLLDEVDAPLDDANVERFCRLVKEMSETVQFIFISHNKVSMEMAERLTGVTMAEPGCSRIVAVDIAEAAALAQIE